MIGHKFKSIREARGQTLRDVKNDTGISDAHLSQLENGIIKNPSYRIIKQLTEYYGMKFDIDNLDELTVLASTMVDAEVEQLTMFAKFIISQRKSK